MENQSGRTEFNLWSPKAGLLWDIDPTWQAYANVSRSAEVPSFGESASECPGDRRSSRSPASGRRRATTYEIGTRGRRPDLTWELTGYRADITDELLCLYSAFGNCNVTNADRTIHQGIEAGLGAAVFKGLFVHGQRAGQDLVQPRLHLQRFPLRQRSGLRQQHPAGRAAPLPSRRAALQASERVLRRPEPRMGTAVLLCR